MLTVHSLMAWGSRAHKKKGPLLFLHDPAVHTRPGGLGERWPGRRAGRWTVGSREHRRCSGCVSGNRTQQAAAQRLLRAPSGSMFTLRQRDISGIHLFLLHSDLCAGDSHAFLLKTSDQHTVAFIGDGIGRTAPAG